MKKRIFIIATVALSFSACLNDKSSNSFGLLQLKQHKKRAQV